MKFDDSTGHTLHKFPQDGALGNRWRKHWNIFVTLERKVWEKFFSKRCLELCDYNVCKISSLWETNFDFIKSSTNFALDKFSMKILIHRSKFAVLSCTHLRIFIYEGILSISNVDVLEDQSFNGLVCNSHWSLLQEHLAVLMIHMYVYY